MTATLRIGAAVLDVAARTLAGPVDTVRLPAGQAVQLLAHLAERPGLTVRWGEAIEAIYGGGPNHGRDPYIVVIGRLVVVRKALREVAAGAEIETVRGVGIRLRVPVQGAADAGPQEAA